MQEYVRVRVQISTYIGYSPADDLSADCRRMGYFVSDSFGGAFPNLVPATLEIRASYCHTSAPLQGRPIYSNSRVHGNRTLYAEAGPYHYKLLLLNCCFRACFLARESRR